MLVDLTLAKHWLNLEPDFPDALVQPLTDQAQAIVIDFIKRPQHGWTQETVPAHVAAAILHVLKRLYDDRAGELEGGPLPDHVKDMLWRERDPALA